MTVDARRLRELIRKRRSDQLATAAVEALPDLLEVYEAAERFARIHGLPFGNYTAEHHEASNAVCLAVQASKQDRSKLS